MELLLAGFIFAYYNFILKAEVIVSTDQKIISEEVPVTLSSEVDTSAADKTIKLHTKSIDVEG
jgi:hypothetical protein